MDLPVDEGVIRSLKKIDRWQMIQLVIVGIDSQKQTPKVVNLGILKLHALSWEDVIEETVQKLILIKLSFSLLIKPKHDMT